MIKRTLSDEDAFKRLKEYLISNNENFHHVSSGSAEKIIHIDKVHGETQWSFFDFKQSKGRGHHLSKAFKKEINVLISKDKKRKNKKIRNYPLGMAQLFNESTLKTVIGKEVLAMDINDCYWQTAFNLGYISEKLYKDGLRKKEWKLGRNACIGGLNKSTTIQPYNSGVKEQVITVYAKEKYRQVRDHIIYYVYRLFIELYRKNPDKFYMFLTDCIFTTKDNESYIRKYFKSFGYKCKVKHVKILSLDKELKRVMWIDEEERIKTGDLDHIKHYTYSSSMILKTIQEK